MKKFSKFYIGFILFLLFAPIVVMIFFSFNAGKSTAVFTGFSLKWYGELFKNSEILNALKNSLILSTLTMLWGFPGGPMVKNPPANAGEIGSFPGAGISHILRSN